LNGLGRKETQQQQQYLKRNRMVGMRVGVAVSGVTPTRGGLASHSPVGLTPVTESGVQHSVTRIV
jgi:hypothetical protein